MGAKPGVSIADYATSRGVSAEAVRKALRQGRLPGAKLARGRIDPDVANKAWVANSSRPTTRHRQVDGVNAAQRRRSAAACSKFWFLLQQLRAGLIADVDIDAVAEQTAAVIERELAPMPSSLATIAGQPPQTAGPAIKAAVWAKLAAIAQLPDLDLPVLKLVAPDPSVEPDFESMNNSQLTIAKADIAAEYSRLQDGRNRGVYLDRDVVQFAYTDAVANTKSKLFGLEKVAPRVRGMSAQELEAWFEHEIGENVLYNLRHWHRRIGDVDRYADERWA
jgi:hypothetical protein